MQKHIVHVKRMQKEKIIKLTFKKLTNRELNLSLYK